ncbi:MAG: T9SS type A sorting domain-containing protein [Ignavibacteria bacterium]
MKTTLFKVLIALMFIFSIQSNSFSYLITIQHPAMCPDDPSFVIYPDFTIDLEFSITSHHAGDIDTIFYTVYIEQNGIQLELAQGVAVSRETVLRTVNIQNFSGLCFNELAIIRIDAIRYNGFGAIYKQKGYFISYKEGKSCNNSVVLNGTSQLLNTGWATFYRGTPCSAVSSSNYYTNQYKVSFLLTGDFNLNDSIPVIHEQFTNGYNGALPNYQGRHSYIEYMNDHEIKFITFVYKITNIIGQDLGFIPCKINEAAVVYRWVKRPVIANLTQFPVPLTTLNNSGIIQCYTFSGNELSYEWKDTNDANNMFTLTPHGSCAVVKWFLPVDNLNNSAAPPYEVLCRAYNALGYSDWKKIRVFYTTQTPQCPVIVYSDTLTGDITENSVLLSSKYFSGKMIRDHYMLMNPLLPEKDIIEFILKENGNDKTEIDELKLYQVVTDKENEIAVTQSGEFISYPTSESKSLVTLNGTEDLSDILNSDDSNFADLKKNDMLSIISDKTGKELYLILIPIIPINKDKPAGKVILTDGAEYEFFSRDNENVICIKIDNLPDNELTIELAQDISMDQILLTGNSRRVKVHELPAIKSQHNLLGDIREFIKNEDGKNVLIDSLNYVDFAFQNFILDKSKVRYILKTTGMIGNVNSSPEGLNYSDKKSDENNNLSSELFNNLPNPFNPTTTIRYNILNQGHVKLKVYDILGNEAALLVNENQNPGSYSVNFDGSNFPSGVYFYRLESPGFMGIKRMILLK